MTLCPYKLNYEEYNIKNALLWGQFLGHCNRVKQSDWKGRCIHVIFAFLEVLPIVGQIISLFELLIIKSCCVAAPIPRQRRVSFQGDAHTDANSNRSSPERLQRPPGLPNGLKEELQNKVALQQQDLKEAAEHREHPIPSESSTPKENDSPKEGVERSGVDLTISCASLASVTTENSPGKQIEGRQPTPMPGTTEKEKEDDPKETCADHH